MVRNIQQMKNPGGSNHFKQLVSKFTLSNQHCHPRKNLHFTTQEEKSGNPKENFTNQKRYLANHFGLFVPHPVSLKALKKSVKNLNFVEMSILIRAGYIPHISHKRRKRRLWKIFSSEGNFLTVNAKSIHKRSSSVILQCVILQCVI